jgi:hypothetical protein
MINRLRPFRKAIVAVLAAAVTAAVNEGLVGELAGAHTSTVIAVLAALGVYQVRNEAR